MDNAEVQAATDDGLVTRRELAAEMGVVVDTVTKWERQGMPTAVVGRSGRPSRYSVAEVRAWLERREEAAQASGLVDVAQERARKERAQAELAEQTFRIRAGQYVAVDELEKALAARVAATRTKLLAWQQTLADRVHRASTIEGVPGVERVLAEAVAEVLHELSALSTPLPAGPGKAHAA